MISEASLNRVVNNIKNAKTFFFATVDENNQFYSSNDGVLAFFELAPGVANEALPDDEPDELVLVSPNILIILERHLFSSTPKFSRTFAATPSPSLIKPSKRCSVPM